MTHTSWPYFITAYSKELIIGLILRLPPKYSHERTIQIKTVDNWVESWNKTISYHQVTNVAMCTYHYFIATEKLVLEKLDLLELTERRTTISDRLNACTTDEPTRHSGKGRVEATTAGVSRRKRTQSGEEDFTMPCGSSQQDTSSVNTSKRLCTSKYFSSPEDCDDVDISFS